MKNDVWTLNAPAQPAGNTERSPLLDAKVMMVDDEPLMTDLIQTHLEDAGYRNFVVANDPRDALALLHREQPGVLLLDLMMPQLSGFDLLQAIRADAALMLLPVIVLTASTGADSKLRALQLGATDFLAKPVDESELALRVRNTLAFRQYHDRLLNFDAPTGLPNQRLFDRAVDTAAAHPPAAGGVVAVLGITVPECRQLRDSIDQAAADSLAGELARRLERFDAEMPGAGVRGRGARVGRLGLDQLGLLLVGVAGMDAVEVLVKQLVAALSQPVSLGQHEVVPTPWIGIASAPDDGADAAALRKSADLALAQAQQLGTLQYRFASPELNARNHERLALGLQLRGAAQRGELRLHYQPKIDLASGRIVGAEALVRWQHPDQGLLPPGRFISLAEELGLIGGIGEWVLEQACRDAAGWSARGLGSPKIAVNVAKPQFVAGNLVALLRQAMLDSGLPAERLVVELTESMLMSDVEAGRAMMHELKALGVTLSIDDFGTGYSSLSYLKTFPLDELKIDSSFVIDLPGRDADMAIVRAIVALGHSLGMSVTAEGVETDAQHECLRELGCNQAQGYLFSRPVPNERLVELLAAGTLGGRLC